MTHTNKNVGVGLVGLGYWGPKVMRNFMVAPRAEVVAFCDTNKQKLDSVHHPGALKTANYDELLACKELDAVVLCVPTDMHYPFAKKALEAGKHVWVEKPMTDSAKTAMELHLLAKEKGLTLFVDHVFLYNTAILKMKELIKRGILGQIYYIESTRVNLGLFQRDVNVVWDLAPHDIAILNYLVEKDPISVTATGAAHVHPGREEMAYINLTYDDGMIAHFNFNWLSPVKERRMVIGGSQRLLVYDDGETDEKIKIYDKGVYVNEQASEKGRNTILVNYRMGDMTAPYIDFKEPLWVACNSFVDAILSGTPFPSTGLEGAKVVQLIEAIQISLKENGKKVDFNASHP